MLIQRTKNIQSWVRKPMFILGMIALVAAGCNDTTVVKKNVSINVWTQYELSETIQSFVETFRQAHPNITINVTKKNEQSYEDDLIKAFAKGEGPDIFEISNNAVPKYRDLIGPATLDDKFNISTYKKDFVDPVNQDFVRDGKIYGVALSVDSLALYYNKSLLGTEGIAQPARSWAELEKHVAQVKRQNSSGVFTRSGVAIGLPADSYQGQGGYRGNVNRAQDVLSLYMLQMGSTPFSADGLMPTFTDSVDENGQPTNPAESALNFYTSFARSNSDNYNWNQRSKQSVDSFTKGEVAYMYGFSYIADTLKSKAPNLNYAVTEVPQYSLSKDHVNFARYSGYVVNGKAPKDNQTASWMFLRYLSEKPQVDSYITKKQVPTSRRDLVDKQLSDPVLGVFAKANLTAKSFYKPDEEKMDQILNQAIADVVIEGKDAGEAMGYASSQSALLTQPEQ